MLTNFFNYWHSPSERKRTFFFVALFSILAALYQATAQGFTAPLLDDLHYLNTAYKLVDIGVFTRIGDDNVPANFVGPLYVGLLALIALVDNHFYLMLACLAGASPTTCSLEGMLSLFIVQSMLGASLYILIFYTIKRLSQKDSLAFITLFIIVLSGAYGEYFSLALTETLAFCLLAATLYFWIDLVTAPKASLNTPLYLGLVLGLVTLTRPAYLYLSCALLIIFCAYSIFYQKRSVMFLLKQVIVSSSSYVVLISPWILRNYVQFGNFELTGNYGTIVLAQRLGYNAMTWNEYWVSFIYWAPKIGEPLAQMLFDENLYRRLGWFAPDSYFRVWAKGQDNADLIRQYIIGDFFKHMAVTITIAIRGMWAGGVVSILGLLCLIPALIGYYRQKSLLTFLLFLFPSVFMLGFHAFVSANVVRYNIPLVIIYAYCFSYVLMSFPQRYASVLEKFRRHHN